jgi:Tfp pilus assembly protein PilF
MESGFKLRLLVTVSAAAMAAVGLAACADPNGNAIPGVQAVVSSGSQKDGASLSVSMTDPYALGKTYLMAGQTGLAVDSFLKAVAKNPKSIQTLNALAAAYDELHRYDLADKYYNAALDIDPHSAQTLNNLGYSHLLRGDVAEAKKYLDESKTVARGDATINANLALADKSENEAKASKAADLAAAEGKAKSPVAALEITSSEQSPSAYPRIERTNWRVQTLLTKPAVQTPPPQPTPAAKVAAVEVSGKPEHVEAVTTALPAEPKQVSAPAQAALAAVKDEVKDSRAEAISAVPEVAAAAAKVEAKESDHVAPAPAPVPAVLRDATAEISAPAKDEIAATPKDEAKEVPAAQTPKPAPMATDEAKEPGPQHITPDPGPAAAKDEAKEVPVTQSSESAPAATEEAKEPGPQHITPDPGPAPATAKDEAKVTEQAAPQAALAPAKLETAPAKVETAPAKVETKAIPVVTAPPESTPTPVSERAKGPIAVNFHAGDAGKGSESAAILPAKAEAKFVPVWHDTPAVKAKSEAAAPTAASAPPAVPPAAKALETSAADRAPTLTEPTKARFVRVVEAVWEASKGGKMVAPDEPLHETAIAQADSSRTSGKQPLRLAANAPGAHMPGLRAQFSQSVASVIEALGGCKGGQGMEQRLCAKLGGLAGGQVADSAHAKDSGNID